MDPKPNGVQIVRIVLLALLNFSVVCCQKYIDNCLSVKNHTVTKYCVDYITLKSGALLYSLGDLDSTYQRDSFVNHLMSNNCPDDVSINPISSSNDYCYCKLGFPLPRHPITHGYYLPNGLKCMTSLNQKDGRDKHRISSNSLHYCSSLSDDKISLTSRLQYLCIFKDNLEQIGQTYEIPHTLSKSTFHDLLLRHKDRFVFSWMNSSILFKANASLTKGRLENLQTGGKNTDQIHNNNTSTQDATIAEEYNGIKYEWIKNESEQTERVNVDFIPGSNLSFSFSGTGIIHFTFLNDISSVIWVYGDSSQQSTNHVT